MAARYTSKLQVGGKITIPVEICHQDKFTLRKGSLLRQSVNDNSILLYKAGGETASEAIALDSGYTIALKQQYLEQLDMQEGERLYFSVEGDLILVDKARCEQCGTLEQIVEVEYMPCHFRCTNCIACTIHWEQEHRR